MTAHSTATLDASLTRLAGAVWNLRTEISNARTAAVTTPANGCPDWCGQHTTDPSGALIHERVYLKADVPSWPNRGTTPALVNLSEAEYDDGDRDTQRIMLTIGVEIVNPTPAEARELAAALISVATAAEAQSR